MPLITLASGSRIRATLLRNAGLEIEVKPVSVDEAAIRESLLSDGANVRDIADVLAETKARRASNTASTTLVLGCDQLLECDGQILSKPANADDARQQLSFLRNRTHRLVTAAVLYADAKPVWRHVSTPRLTMRDFSDGFLDAYVYEQWENIRNCVGCYQVEGVGLRLFSRIEGDLFSIQGLPLLEFLAILTQRGDIDR